MSSWKFLGFTAIVLFISLFFAFILVDAYLEGNQPIGETYTSSAAETTTSSVTDQSTMQPAFAVPEVPMGTPGAVGAVFAGLVVFALSRRKPDY